MSSLVYEANARMRDPVYGCVGAISYLQNQVSQLQMQLAVAQAEILCIQMQQEQQAETTTTATSYVTTTTTQMELPDEKSLLLSTSNSNFSNLQQYFSYASSSSVIQDPLKRESLWT